MAGAECVELDDSRHFGEAEFGGDVQGGFIILACAPNGHPPQVLDATRHNRRGCRCKAHSSPSIVGLATYIAILRSHGVCVRARLTCHLPRLVILRTGHPMELEIHYFPQTDTLDIGNGKPAAEGYDVADNDSSFPIVGMQLCQDRKITIEMRTNGEVLVERM